MQGSSVRKTCRIARTHVPCPLALLGTTTLAVCPFFLFRTRGLSAGRMGEEGSSAPSRSQGKSYLWKQPLPFALVPQPGACSRSLCFSSHGINPAHAFPFLPGFPLILLSSFASQYPSTLPISSQLLPFPSCLQIWAFIQGQIIWFFFSPWPYRVIKQSSGYRRHS